jgi:hypothetical protein
MNLCDMMNRAWLLIFIVILISCFGKKDVPEFITEKIPAEKVVVKSNLQKAIFDSSRYVLQNPDIQKQLDDLMISLRQFQSKNDDFRLDRFEIQWEQFHQVANDKKLNVVNTKNWFQINGTLLQLTGEAKYAEELEKLMYTGLPGDSLQVNNWTAPYIYTKYVDHIHVNLFAPSEISYQHSLRGSVKIAQETGYTPSGDLQIHFSMEKERYIELFIRIPGWAKGATVTMQNVKYVAHPGEYCKIAKEWNEGDIVEIHFPMESSPEYIKNSISG